MQLSSSCLCLLVMPYKLLSSGALISLLQLYQYSSLNLCQLGIGNAQVWLRESGIQDPLYGVGNWIWPPCLKAKGDWPFECKFPSHRQWAWAMHRGSSCLLYTLVFTILGHQGLAWHILGDFKICLSALCPAPVILCIPW